MKPSWKFRTLGFLLIGGLLAGLAWGDTIELVTYYPTDSDLDLLDVVDLSAVDVAVGDPLPIDDARAPLRISGDGSTTVRINIDNPDQTGNNDSSISLRNLVEGAGADDNRVLLGRLTNTHVSGGAMLLQNIAHGASVGRYWIDQGGAHRFQAGNTDPWDRADLSIAPSGRVGIGTATPESLLHVLGRDDTDDIISFMPGQDTAAAGAPTMRVGIGTVAPQAGLHVIGGIYVLGGDGDVNDDDSLTSLDMLEIIAHLNNPQGRPLTPAARIAADVNGDGAVNTADINAIMAVIDLRGSGPLMTEAEREAVKQQDPIWRTIFADEEHNLGVLAYDPMDGISLPPNGVWMGNVNANDVYLRGAGGGQWASTLGGGLGAWDDAPELGTVYQAATNGIVMVTVSGNDARYTISVVEGFSDANDPPTTLRGSATWSYSFLESGYYSDSFTMPVREGDYWLVNETRARNAASLTKAISWIPLE